MEKKYFLVSDIHSFFTPFKKALDNAGYDKNNSEHILVVLGDIFDRGTETKEVYDFLISIDSSRLILIKGNHEELFLNLTKKYEPEYYDFTNGTVRTFCAIAGFPYSKISDIYDNWQKIKGKVTRSDIFKFIKSDIWKDYYILKDKYVCVHSFVPQSNGKNWKHANYFMWNEARWGCPYELHEKYWKEIGGDYTLVCGHWHVSDFHKRYEGIENDFSIYRGETLIGIDACTALTGKANVLVL